jgi:hypothetical protein
MCVGDRFKFIRNKLRGIRYFSAMNFAGHIYSSVSVI